MHIDNIRINIGVLDLTYLGELNLAWCISTLSLTPPLLALLSLDTFLYTASS